MFQLEGLANTIYVIDNSNLKDWQGEVETLGEWQSQLDGAENMGEQGQNYN